MPIKVEFFPNGQLMAFDGNNQVGDLQKAYLILFAEHAAAKGFDPTQMEIIMPNGQAVRIIKTTDGGFTWKRL